MLSFKGRKWSITVRFLQCMALCFLRHAAFTYTSMTISNLFCQWISIHCNWRSYHEIFLGNLQKFTQISLLQVGSSKDGLLCLFPNPYWNSFQFYFCDVLKSSKCQLNSSRSIFSIYLTLTINILFFPFLLAAFGNLKKSIWMVVKCKNNLHPSFPPSYFFFFLTFQCLFLQQL